MGSPNCGKSALFNRLTGSRAKVANYAGVTVERRSGVIRGLEHDAELVDLPGTYSLYVASPDELITRRFLLGELEGEAPPDVIVAVVDATNIELGLRLVLELGELQRPMIVALNLSDVARRRGLQIDCAHLSELLGVPVVPTVGVARTGADQLRAAMDSVVARVEPGAPVRHRLERGSASEETYSRIDEMLEACVSQPQTTPKWQDRLDHIVLHPVWGCVVLLSVLLLMFQAVFAWSAPLIGLIDSAFQLLGTWVAEVMPAGILQDFLINGLIAGVGGVLVFIPQIIILFGFILVLEDSGYLPRASFLLDRLMRGVGLSGRSFIPLLSSFACAIPGIMATRTIPDPRERLIAIMVAPLMTCSARLPVYTLIIAAFVPRAHVGVLNLQGLVLFVLYLSGILSAAAVSWVMTRRTSTGDRFPLLLELPSYRWPHPYHLLVGLKERAVIFLRRVGTIVLALSIIIWFLATFPGAPAGATAPAIEFSIAGRLGHFMQPLFAPLGFNWQMCIALIPAMAAREVAVSALATVYAVSQTGNVERALGAVLEQSWSLPIALAFLAWFVFAPQCLATIAVVRRETNSAASTAVFTGYLFALAYVGAGLTYWAARALVGA